MTEPILKVQGLTVEYDIGAGRFQAVTDVSFEVTPGRVVGIVGETGCGKSTLAKTIPRLLPEPPAQVRAGKIIFHGTDLAKVPKWKLPMVRGTGIGMIFQEPLNSLNPSFRIYDQIAEAVQIRHFRESGVVPWFQPQLNAFDYSKPAAPAQDGGLAKGLVPGGMTEEAARKAKRVRGDFKEDVLDFLRLVRINDPETILDLYPHELSGGMRQRVMIATALSQKPSLLIADEPTSALDVTIQAQVLTLMKELIDEVRASILFISHDLGVIAETADDLGVMYAGRLVEFGPVAEIFENPRHPYTKALLQAAPNRYKSEGPLNSIAGAVPNLSRPPPGCRFHPRCPIAQSVCRVDPAPPLAPVGSGPSTSTSHRSACHFSDKVPGLP